MASRIKKREWLAILIVLAIFAAMLGNYFNGKKVLIAIKNDIYYLRYLHEYTGYFPDSRIVFKNGGFHLMFPPQEEGNADQVPALLYHGIIKTPDGFSVTAANFKDQLFALKRAGYTTITMQQFVDFINGKDTVPKHAILITFDDGRTDSYTGADTLFATLHYNATMFIATRDSLVGKNGESKYYLGTDQLESMIKSGRWEIQSHAVQETGGLVPVDAEGNTGQFLSSRKWLEDKNRLETEEEYHDRITYELTESKKQIESVLHEPVISFAYPYGDYGQQSENNTAHAIADIKGLISKTYQVAFQQTWQDEGEYTSNFSGDNRIYLKRIEIGSTWTGQDLINYLQKSETKPLPYSDTFIVNNGWKNNWGSLLFSDNALELRAKKDSTGGFTFLDGTYPWKNYLASADIDANGSLTFVVYYKDPKNYYSCDVLGAYARLVEVQNGTSNTLLEKKINPLVGAQHIEVGIQGNRFTCTIGKVSLAVKRNALLKKNGGVGFKIWKQKNGQASLMVHNLQIVRTKTEP